MPPTRPLADSGCPLSLHQCRSRVLEPAKLASSWLPLVIPEDKVSYSHRTTTTTADADAATTAATATTHNDDYDDYEKLEALSTSRNLKPAVSTSSGLSLRLQAQGVGSIGPQL